MPVESVAGRYDRDWKQLQDTRKMLGFDQQGNDLPTANARWKREYVDAATGNTVATTGDNNH